MRDRLVEIVAGLQNSKAITIAVDRNADGGPGSLRAALVTAAAGGTISISAGLVIALTSGELLVGKERSQSIIAVEGTLHHHAAIDREYLAGDVFCLRRSEKRDPGSDVFYLA